jgi:hypothetical protein
MDEHTPGTLLLYLRNRRPFLIMQIVGNFRRDKQLDAFYLFS